MRRRPDVLMCDKHALSYLIATPADLQYDGQPDIPDSPYHYKEPSLRCLGLPKTTLTCLLRRSKVLRLFIGEAGARGEGKDLPGTAHVDHMDHVKVLVEGLAMRLAIRPDMPQHTHNEA